MLKFVCRIFQQVNGGQEHIWGRGGSCLPLQQQLHLLELEVRFSLGNANRNWKSESFTKLPFFTKLLFLQSFFFTELLFYKVTFLPNHFFTKLLFNQMTFFQITFLPKYFFPQVLFTKVVFLPSC